MLTVEQILKTFKTKRSSYIAEHVKECACCLEIRNLLLEAHSIMMKDIDYSQLRDRLMEINLRLDELYVLAHNHDYKPFRTFMFTDDFIAKHDRGIDNGTRKSF